MVTEFMQHIIRLGYSQSSQNMFKTCISEFLQMLGINNAYSLGNLKQEHIKYHYNYLTERPNKRRPGGLSEKMISHHMYSIRLFLNYHEQIGTIAQNPISGLKFPSPRSEMREILSVREIKYLYDETINYRERAILGLFYGCGLRRSEGVALNVQDINFNQKLLYVRHGKGKKRRAIPINESVLTDFDKYLYEERQTHTNGQAFVLNRLARRTQGNSYNEVIKKLVGRAIILKTISLHSLRHSIATHLLQNGLPVEDVRDFLGHNHLEATQIYTHVSKNQLYEL